MAKTMGYSEALSSRPKPAKAGPKELREYSIEKADNGGHIAKLRFHQENGPYHEPESHVFGADEGHKLIAHMSKHMGLKGASAKAEESAEGEA